MGNVSKILAGSLKNQMKAKVQQFTAVRSWYRYYLSWFWVIEELIKLACVLSFFIIGLLYWDSWGCSCLACMWIFGLAQSGSNSNVVYSYIIMGDVLFLSYLWVLLCNFRFFIHQLRTFMMQEHLVSMNVYWLSWCYVIFACALSKRVLLFILHGDINV